MRSGESDKSNQSKEAKGERRVSFTEADARRRDKRDTQSGNESFPSTREFDKMVVDAYTRDSNFRQELKDNPTRAIESRFAQFFPDGKISKERIYKVLQDAPDLHHLVLPSSRDESRTPELDHKAIAKQADKNIRRDESVVVTCNSDRCGNNDDSMCVITCLSCN